MRSLLALLAVLCVAGWLQPAGIASAAPAPLSAADAAGLARARSIAEIQLADAQRDQALQEARSARSADKWWRWLLPIGATLISALATAYVAYRAIVLPLQRQREKDRAERREAALRDAKQRDEAARQEAGVRRRELVQRFDVTFGTAVTALADTRVTVQAGGAAALRSFLRADLAEFHDQTYQVVRAHLDRRIVHEPAVRAILVPALVELLRSRSGGAVPPSVPRSSSRRTPKGVDLTSIWLQKADLHGVNLSEADLWGGDISFARLDGATLRRARAWKCQITGASFRDADLEEARFRAVRGHRAVFDGARLVSARFEEADLEGARLCGAKLQSAHFDGARLSGANFRDAVVTDAYFTGAEFDDVALSSLVLARGLWIPDPATRFGSFAARLDPPTEQRLLHAAKQRGWNWQLALA